MLLAWVCGVRPRVRIKAPTRVVALGTTKKTIRDDKIARDAPDGSYFPRVQSSSLVASEGAPEI